MKEAEVFTTTPADNGVHSIAIRFPDDGEIVFFDSKEEAVEFAEDTKETLTENDITREDDPHAWAMLDDVREQAEEVFP